MSVFVDVDPHAPHKEECSFWHGGTCDCHPAMIASRAVERHCHECDFVNSYSGSAACNCKGFCICEREEGCPCVGKIEPDGSTR